MNKRKKLKYSLLIFVLLCAVIWSFFIGQTKAEIDGDYQFYLKSTPEIEIVHVPNKSISYTYQNGGVEHYIILIDERLSYLAYASLAYNLSVKAMSDVTIINYGYLGKYESLWKLKAFNNESINIIAHGNGADLLRFYGSSRNIKSLILLGGNPSFKLDYNKPVLSIHANFDGLLSKNDWLSSQNKLGDDVILAEIEKGNFSSFTQSTIISGDFPALISYEEQQQQTIDYIIDFMGTVNN